MTILGLSILAICLVLVAVGFLVAELFLPTHGLLAGGSGLCAIGAVAVLLNIHTTLGLIGAIILLLAAPFVFYYCIKMYPNTMVGRKVLLGPAVIAKDAAIQELMGKNGTTLTQLRPAGTVQIDTKRIDCQTEGDMIEPGKHVTVVSVSNGRVVVREITANA